MKIAATLFKVYRLSTNAKALVVRRSSFVFVLAFFFTLFTLTFAPMAHAQTTNYSQNRDTMVKNDLYSVLGGLNEMLYGKTGEKGALGGAANLIASLFRQPPASGIAYFSQEIHKFNPFQPVYAAVPPIGTQIINPTQLLWQVFRNASYLGFIIVFVIIGFMVMFRAHISPQAVATVQDSLPRIVIALLLVTFSYAIAGLLIDFMFVILNVAIVLLQNAGLDPSGSRRIFDSSVFSVYKANWDDVFGAVSNVVGDILDQIIKFDGNPLFNIVGYAITGLLSNIVGLIAGIALLFIMFRVFLMLLMSYVMVILLTVFSPFFFLFQALPGQNGAKIWFKQYVANLSVFAVVPIMLLLAGLLGGLGDLGGGSPLIQDTQTGYFPLLSNIVKAGSAGKLIGLGILFMTPEAANLIKKFLGTQGAPGFGGAGAAALGASAGFFGRRAQTSAPVQGMQGLMEVGKEERKFGMMNRISKTFGGAGFERGLQQPYKKK